MKHIRERRPAPTRALLARSGSNPPPAAIRPVFRSTPTSTALRTPVDPYLYTSISLSGSFAADDTAIVKLNGVPIATCPGGNTPATWCFHSWKPIPPAGLSAFNRLGSFLNTLTVEVQNTQAGSSSGLIVQAQVTRSARSARAPCRRPIRPAAAIPRPASPGRADGGPSARSSTRDPAPWASSLPRRRGHRRYGEHTT